MGYRYDATRKALLTPARDAVFFAEGRPAAEAALCAEMARLGYAAFDRDPAGRALLEGTLRGIGFTGCTTFDAGSTQGFLASDPKTALSVLAFRGTELDPGDWATDLDAVLIPWAEGGRVHQGFATALDAAWPPISTALGLVHGRLLFTGHSLGAALATLASTRRPPDALYTFGSPRAGDDGFAALTASLPHQRFTNCCDIVTRVPLEAMGYRHVTPAAYLDRQGTLYSAPAEALIAEDQRRARRSYLFTRTWRLGTMWTRDAADHAPVNYLRAVSHALRGAA